MFRGSCLCGDVAWEHPGPPQFVGACHCSMCRKSNGVAFSMVVGAPGDGFRWTRGEDAMGGYASSPASRRQFCSRCGSPLPGEPGPGRPMILPSGCLDDDPGLPLSAHIFVASKAGWHEIAEDVPCFDAFPPGMDAPVIERQRQTEARPGALRGSCLCGGAAYEIEGEPYMFLRCHCSRCRKAHGAPYSSLLLAKLEQLRWLRGEELVERYKVPEGCFCRVCGSSLPQVLDHPPVVIPAGSLDDDPASKPWCHIFTGSKAAWFQIADDLPQFETYPTAQS